MRKVPAVFNSIRLSEIDRDEVLRLSALNYSPKEIALFLGVDEKLFCNDAEIYGTDINLLMRRGKFVNQVSPEIKMQELAEEGNITAIQELRKLKEQRTFENWVKQMDDHEL